MKIINYEPKYKKEIIRLYNDFHNYIVSVDPDGKFIPFACQDDVVKYVNKIIKYFIKKNGYIYIALIDDKVTGFIMGNIDDLSKDKMNAPISKPEIYGYISELYVDNNYQRKGVGLALFNKAKKYFKTKKCTSIRLYVLDSNKKAVKFYEKLNMKIQGFGMNFNLN